MNSNFFTNIKNIRTAIDTNKLVVFVGAGISIDAGIPGWNVLINEMKSEINIPKNEFDYLRIAQMYFNDRQQKEYIDKIRSVLKHKKTKFNEIHEQIFQLNPTHVLTTNYDDLLEQVIKKQSLPFSIVSQDKEFPYALNTNLLIKIHGDLDETDIVLKEDDYLDYSLNHPLMEAFLKSVFASKIVLFIGYGFSDINLKMILQTVRNILGKDFQNAYLLSVDENLHQSQREYLKNKGINVVNYYDAVNEDGENYITEYLNGKNALSEIYYKKVENLSVKGQNLFNFLVFISTYDKFNEPLTEQNLIDQIFLSLARFSELKSLPPDFIANVYPFNNSKDYVHNYEAFSLLTRNHTLYDLFFNQIEYVNDEVKFKPTLDMNLSSVPVTENEQKLNEIIRTLNRSLIFHIFKENERPDHFGLHGWSESSQKLIVKPSDKCNCPNCRLNRFELSSALSEIFNSSVNETTGIQSDMEIAYANYKIGNFNQAFRLFEEVANKSWQAGKYFSYYIAKHNIKTLRNLIFGYETTLKDEDRRKIIKELDNMDFDMLLFQIPYLGENEDKLFKIIRDDDILHKASNQIDSIYENILNAYDGYKEGRTWIMGPYYPQAIEIEFYKIISFYNNNCIIADEFRDFKKACKKGIEALLISFATSEEYKEKLTEFNKLFFDVVVFYCKPKEIKAITEKYQISKLNFDDKSLQEILDSVNNFLKSFFERNLYFGRKTLVNKVTRNQLNNTFFEDRCKQNFSNIFLLLSGIELNKDIAGDLIKNLLGFIEHETFLSRSEVEFLCGFISKNYRLFSKEDFENLLKSILHKLYIYNEGHLLKVIAHAFKENNFIGISNQDVIFKILSLSRGSDLRAETITYLWEISDELIKEELKKKIITILDEKFDSELYTNASIKNIIDFDKYFNIYIQEINATKGSGSYILNSGQPKLDNFIFINSMIFIYIMKIDGNDARLNAFTDLADYMKFYLNPEKFDYKNFRVEWLHIVDGRKIFFQRFSKTAALKDSIEKSLKHKFDKDLAEIYAKYFI